MPLFWMGTIGLALIGPVGATATEQAAIAAVVDKYFRGVSEANPALLEEAFAAGDAHLKAIVVGDQGEEGILIEKVTDSIKRWTREPDPGAKGRLLSVDVVDDRVATAKFEFVWKGRTYVDFLSLYKLGGQWKIVNKVFVAR